MTKSEVYHVQNCFKKKFMNLNCASQLKQFISYELYQINRKLQYDDNADVCCLALSLYIYFSSLIRNIDEKQFCASILPPAAQNNIEHV